MPTFHVKAPNGRTYRVNAPEGATATDALRMVQRSFAKGTPPPPAPAAPHPRTWADTFADARYVARHAAGSVVNGLTGSWADEVAGAGGALRNVLGAAVGHNKLEPTAAFTREKRVFEQEQAQWERDHHTAHLAATGAGMAASIVLPEFRGARAVQGAAQATRLSRMYRAGRTGAIYGAASGAGKGEGSDRIRNAGEGLVGGAVVGAAAEPLITTATATAGKLRNVVAPYLSRTAGQRIAHADAQRQVAQALTSGGLTPADASSAVAQRAAIDVPASVSDLTDQARDLTARSAAGVGPAQAAVRRAIEARQASMAQRTRGHIDATLGPVADPHGQSDALLSQARDAARPLYAEAYATPVTMTPRLREFADSPIGPQALEAGANQVRITPTSARNVGSEQPFAPGTLWDPQLGSYRSGEVPVLETWDGAKRHLDDMEGAAQSRFLPTPAGMTSDTRAVDLRRRELLQELDAQVPAYAQARAAYAGPAQELQAFRTGLEELPGSRRSTAGDARAQMGRMTDSQLAQFRLGDRTRLADKVYGEQNGPGRWSDATAPVTANGARLDLVRTIHGDDAAAALGDRMEAEAQAHATYRATSRGAPHGGAGEALEAASTGLQAARELVRGRPIRAGMTLVSGIGQGRHRAAVRDELGPILTATDVDAVDRAMRGVQHRLDQDALSAQRLQQAAREVARGGVINFVGKDGDQTGLYPAPGAQAPHRADTTMGPYDPRDPTLGNMPGDWQ